MRQIRITCTGPSSGNPRARHPVRHCRAAQGLRLTLARVRVGSHLIRVGKAGATPALPRNCEALRGRATPSQTTGRIDGAVTTFAGEGGFRSAARRKCFPCQRARS